MLSADRVHKDERQRADIAKAISGYVDSGFGQIRNLLSHEEIELLAAESNNLWRRFEQSGPGNLRFGVRTDTSGKVVRNGLDPVADVSETFDALNRDERLISIAEAGLAEPATVMKEKLIFKWPGTCGFGAHRDQSYTTPKSGVPGANVMTISLALDPATKASGPVEFFPGLRHRRMPAPADEPRDVDEGALLAEPSFMPIMQPGDAILFDGRIPHRSGWNRSNRCRRVYMTSYVPARFPHARRNYYAGRLVEQREIRRDLVDGATYFE